MFDRVPLNVLATWLAPDALSRIAKMPDPKHKAIQVDVELDKVGLRAEWRHEDEGPILVTVRAQDPRINPAL